MVCPSCGERKPEGARFCLNGGLALVPPVRGKEERNVVTLAISTARAAIAAGAEGVLGATPWLDEIDATGDARAAVT